VHMEAQPMLNIDAKTVFCPRRRERVRYTDCVLCSQNRGLVDGCVICKGSRVIYAEVTNNE